MTRPGQEPAAADSLPQFLADAAAPDGATAPPDPAPAGDAAGGGPLADALSDEPAVAQPERRAHVRRSADREPVRGGIGIALGATTVAAGIGVGVAQQLGALPAGLGFGIDAATLVTLGAVMAGTALVRRLVGSALARLDAVIHHQDATAELVQGDLQVLVEAQNAAAQRPPAAGEELQRVMIAMQRLDEKLANISKALKMYGKPLMEISSQGADAAAAVTGLRTHVDAMLEANRQAFQRLEIGVRSVLCKKEVEDVFLHVVKLEETMLGQFTALGERLPRTDQLQQQLVRVEATVQALGQRADDSEVRKSLLRLEDVAQRTGEQLMRLAQGESAQAAAQRLEQRLDATAQKLHGGLDALRVGNLGALETTLRDIQREVAGVATAVTQIQAAVRGGAMRGPAPAPSAPATTTTTTTTAAATDATAPAPSGEAHAGNDAQAGVQQNVTGARATSGRNVLGAIARLKQMKG